MPLLRVGLATGLVLVVLVCLLLSYAMPELQLCRYEFPPAATSDAVRVCGPLTSDPILAGFLGLLVLIPVGYIMRPFISKLGFAGLSVETTAMKTQIEETRTAANLALVKAASARVQPIDEAESSEARSTSRTKSGLDHPGLVSPEREAAMTEFNQAWERVFGYLDEIRDATAFGSARLSEIVDWSKRNSFDIAVLRATHDLLKTSPGALSTQDLTDGARRGIWLLARLEGRLVRQPG
jgi:hypothetical protein